MDLRIIKERSIWWVGMSIDMITQIILLECLSRNEGDLKKTQKELGLSDGVFSLRVGRLVRSGIKLPQKPKRMRQPLEAKPVPIVEEVSCSKCTTVKLTTK